MCYIERQGDYMLRERQRRGRRFAPSFFLAGLKPYPSTLSLREVQERRGAFEIEERFLDCVSRRFAQKQRRGTLRFESRATEEGKAAGLKARRYKSTGGWATSRQACAAGIRRGGLRERRRTLR